MIACGTHSTCAKWNADYLATVPGALREFRAANQYPDVGVLMPSNATRVREQDGSIPPDILEVKEGARFKLLRRWQNHPKHTVVIVEKIHKNFLQCQVIDTVAEEARSVADRRIFLPRIEFQWYDDDGEYHCRLQFPLIGAAAQTWHSIQGITVESLFLDVTSSPWTHGTLYTVLGRAKGFNDIAVAIPRPVEALANVVWREFLDTDGSPEAE